MPKIKRESEVVSVEAFMSHIIESMQEVAPAPLYATFAWPESGKSIFQHIREEEYKGAK